VLLGKKDFGNIFCSVTFLLPEQSARQFQLSKKQKRAVLRRWKHEKTEQTTDKSIFPVPKQEQENTQTAIVMVTEAVQITRLHRGKDAPTIFLGCMYYRSVQERIGLKTIGFSVFSRYCRHSDMCKQYQRSTKHPHFQISLSF